ncbi:hypothetical protein JL720_13918 [Aureococcus anophagefferens]|nr:hypothetical protein JL720_13918 [Aureococcus anophagefferens]
MAQRGQKRAADDDGEAAFLADLDGAFEPDEPTALVDAKKQKGRPRGVPGRAPARSSSRPAWTPRPASGSCDFEVRMDEACAHAKWHVIHGSHTSHNERRGPGNNRYLTYNETEGLNNQRIALENARLMAILLNRTLRYFEDHRKRWPTRIRDDAARCGDVATCEDFLLDPPKNVVVEVPVDKTMYHMSLSSPKRWVLSKMKDDRELNPNVLTVNSRLITRAKMIVAHAKYRINKLRNVTMRRSRPLFLMTRGVVESVVCANAHHFVATGSSSMSEWILRLRATRPPWSVLLKHAARPDPGVDCHSAWCFEVPPSERKALPPPPEPKLAPSRRESLDGPLYADELAA